MPKPRNKFIDFTIDNFKAFALGITLVVCILSLYCGFILINHLAPATADSSPEYQLLNAIDQLPDVDFRSNLYAVIVAEHYKCSDKLSEAIKAFTEEKIENSDSR